MTGEPPWSHLLPLVDALVAAGNTVISAGFAPNQGGFDCEMLRPLDFALVRPLARDDNRLRLLVERDEIACLHGPRRVEFDAAVEQVDTAPRKVGHDGRSVELQVGRPRVHAVARRTAEPLCRSADARLLPTGQAWMAETPDHVERCGGCLEVALLSGTEAPRERTWSWVADEVEQMQRVEHARRLIGSEIDRVRYINIDYERDQRAAELIGPRVIVDDVEWSEPTWQFPDCDSIDFGLELETRDGRLFSVTWDPPGLREGIGFVRSPCSEPAFESMAPPRSGT